jgi:hypothetical protein
MAHLFFNESDFASLPPVEQDEACALIHIQIATYYVEEVGGELDHCIHGLVK